MALESSSSLALMSRYKPVLPEDHGKRWLLPGGLVARAAPGVGSQGPPTTSSPGKPKPQLSPRWAPWWWPKGRMETICEVGLGRVWMWLSWKWVHLQELRLKAQGWTKMAPGGGGEAPGLVAQSVLVPWGPWQQQGTGLVIGGWGGWYVGTGESSYLLWHPCLPAFVSEW